MKKLFIVSQIILGVILLKTSYAQTEKYDVIYLDDLSINNFCLKDSISHMYKTFGKPVREKVYESFNEEWTEPNQKKFFYGMNIIDINGRKKVEYDCVFKELRKEKYYDIITGLEINSEKYILNYKNKDIRVGDNIMDEKYRLLFPKSYSECIEFLENCSIIVLIKNTDNKLSDEVASLKLNFENSILKTIIVNYNLE